MKVQPFAYLETNIEGTPPASTYNVSYLIVGGGGGGGYDTTGTATNSTCRSGGGGAGGLQSGSFAVNIGNAYSVIVGAGGSIATNGSDSSVFGLTSLGGGFGGWGANFPSTTTEEKKQYVSGSIGGSGGGGTTGTGSLQRQEGAPGTIPQGNSGSWGIVVQGNYVSMGGGGGSSTAGEGNPNIPRIDWSGDEKAGNGGSGSQWIDGNFYAGGGGGGFSGASDTRLQGVGGIGGGGNGEVQGTGLVPTSGIANTGGGGGGAGGSANTSGQGGSGIVIIAYEGPQRGTGGTVTTSGSLVFHTFTSSNTYTG